MLFQQELWLIIVGIVTAVIYKKTTQTQVSLTRFVFWPCLFALLVGEIGMLSTLFFPSDLLGLILTTFAALLGARFGIKRSGSVISSSSSLSRTHSKKK